MFAWGHIVVTMCCVHPKYTVSQDDLLTSVSQSYLTAAECIPSHARLSAPVSKGITKILCVLDGISKQEQRRCTLLQIKLTSVFQSM